MPYDDDSTPTDVLSDGTGNICSYQWQDSEPPSTALIEVVAAENNCDPLDLPPLQEYIDADALDTILISNQHNSRPPIRVSFEYEGCGITVDSDGDIQIRQNTSDGETSG